MMNTIGAILNIPIGIATSTETPTWTAATCSKFDLMPSCISRIYSGSSLDTASTKEEFGPRTPVWFRMLTSSSHRHSLCGVQAIVLPKFAIRQAENARFVAVDYPVPVGGATCSELGGSRKKSLCWFINKR